MSHRPSSKTDGAPEPEAAFVLDGAPEYEPALVLAVSHPGVPLFEPLRPAGDRNDPTTPGPTRLLTVDEAAAYVGCHRNTVYASAQSGRLRSRSVGRLKRFTIADLDEWTGARP